MKMFGSIVLVCFTLLACTPSGVKKKDAEVVPPTIVADTTKNVLDTPPEVKTDLKMDNGIIISWFKRGTGEKLAYGDYIDIDYKVLLKDGKVVDGNHLLNKESMPFMIGFNMQTPGWEMALKELRVGDFAEVMIPSDLARGEKGIKGLIPPNADNVLRIRILRRKPPTRETDGNKVWVFEENKTNEALFNENSEITFYCTASTPTSRDFINTYRTDSPFTLRLEHDGTVPGLKKALINAKKADRMIVFVPSSQAYGTKGLKGLVKPNQDILYNIMVMDVTVE
jgi:FKBP-type peptidyl-prolyl cis-trans isomerase